MFSTLEAAGTEGDGQMTIVLGVVAVAGVALRRPGTDPRGAVLIAGNAWRNVSRMLDDVDSDYVDASVGIGVYLPIAAEIVTILAARQIRQERSRP